jgi:hypothetical protein
MRSKPTFMETSFSRERGVVEAGRTGFLAWALNLLTASSHEPRAHSDLIAVFVAVTVAGQQRNSRKAKRQGMKDKFFILPPFAFILSKSPLSLTSVCG